jgi:hypothetical protein
LLSYSYNLERAVLIGHFKRQRLLLQCVLETADGVLDLALDLFRRSRDPILIHD